MRLGFTRAVGLGGWACHRIGGVGRAVKMGGGVWACRRIGGVGRAVGLGGLGVP